MEKEAIKEYLEEIHIIYVKAHESYSFNRYLNKPPTEKEFDYLKNSRVFELINISMFKLAVLEMSKLTGKSNSHTYNLPHLITKLKKFYLKDKDIIKELEIARSELKSVEDISDKFKILRDKHYAHTDKLRPDPDVTYIEMDTLFYVVFNIIKKLFLIFLHSELDNTPIFFNPNRFNVIEILADEKERSRKEIIDKYLSKKKPPHMT